MFFFQPSKIVKTVQMLTHHGSDRLRWSTSILSGLYTGTSVAGRVALPLIRSAALSASMMVGELRLPLVTEGITEASTTYKLSRPVERRQRGGLQTRPKKNRLCSKTWGIDKIL